MRVHVSPGSERLFHLPPHPIPFSCSSALFHTLNLDWSFISHMVIYMFQCYSLKSSCPLLLPQSPKICSLYLCLLCCLTYSIVIAIFLNSIHMCWYNVLVFFFLTYFTLYNRLQFHLPHYNWLKCVLFNSWVIFLCVYVPQLSYPFVRWWTSRLLPCSSYYEQCCNEHWGTHISFNSGFLGVYAQKWDCWVIWQFCFQFFKESPHFSP